MIGIRYVTKAEMDTLNVREVLQALVLHKLSKSDQPMQLVDAESEEVTTLSSEMVQLLHDFLMNLLSGAVETTITYDAELTDKQAAEILGVSRAYFVNLLKSGVMPYCKNGFFFTVRMEDLMTYKEANDQERSKALDELTALSQELGLYD